MHISGRTEMEAVFVGGYILIAGVSTMPKPGDKFAVYQWIYDWAHLLLNSPMAMRIESRFQVSQPNGTVSSESKISTTEPAKNA